MLLVLVSVWRLTVTDWTDNLGYVINLAVAAAILGLALGASRFEKRGVRWLILGYTLVFIPRQLLAFYDNEIYIGERLASVGGRLLVSIGEFAADKPVEDPLFFITLMGILYWTVALFSGYQLARHNNTLAAILPAGLTMLVIHQFDKGPADRLWIIALFLLAALTLIGRGKYLRDRIDWVERRVQLAPETGPDLSMGALIGAAALILLAWNLPLDLTGAPALEKKWLDVTQPWRGTRDRLGRAFEALEGEGAAERVETFRSSLSLGSRAAQGSATIFNLDPFIVNLQDNSGTRYLKLTVNLELASPSAQAELNAQTTQIRDSLIILLSSKSYTDIGTVEGKYQMRDEIVSRVNQFLTKSKVKTAYFTEFVIQ